MMAKKKKNLWDRITYTKYSDDKEFLNAVIVSDSAYVPSKKVKKFHAFKLSMYVYAAVILVATLVSLAMLAFSREQLEKYEAPISIIEAIIFIILLVDFIARWYTSEVRLKKGNLSYFLFPFTVTGIFLLLSLLPSLYLINLWADTDYEVFNWFENMKFLRIFRIILLANLVPGISIFKRVLIKEKSTLYVVFGIVLIAIVLFALVMYNIETSEDAFNQYIENQGGDPNDPNDPITKEMTYDDLPIGNFLDAVYFSTVALTTIGFGDISPITNMGKVIVMVMSIIGIAVLATPAGVITGGFIEEIKDNRKRKRKSWKSI